MKPSFISKHAGIWTIATIAAFFSASSFAAYPGAIWTTDPTGEKVNANIYAAACDVYLNGGPNNEHSAGLLPTPPGGVYYFQVTNPSGDVLLSNFSASGRAVSIDSTGKFGGIQLCTFLDTPNPGGEYKVYLVKAFGSDCSGSSIADDGIHLNFTNNCAKTDNFKIKPEVPVCDPDTETCCDPSTDCCQVSCGTAVAPKVGISKTVDEAHYDTTWTWNIAKSVASPSNSCAIVVIDNVSQLRCTQVTGSLTFPYTVTVTSNAPAKSNTTVKGTITITATDGADTNGDPVPVLNPSLVDTLYIGIDEDRNCEISPSVPGSMPNTGTNGNLIWPFTYTCSWIPDNGPLSNSEVNIAALNTDNAGAADYAVDFDFCVDEVDQDHNQADQSKCKKIDRCVAVTDTYGGPLGTVCADGLQNPFTYNRTINVSAGCASYGNDATYTTDTTGNTDTKSQTVRVCGQFKGGLTMGFWQNNNGQGLIKASGPSTGTCALATWLRQFLPFQDLSSSAVCGAVYTSTKNANLIYGEVTGYVYTVIKAANASGASMNAMLKGQMLATALDVYFSDAALGGSLIAAYNGGSSVGGEDVDLTKVCRDAACTTWDVTSGAFNGATHMKVCYPLGGTGGKQCSPGTLLSYAASQSSAGGTPWYGCSPTLCPGNGKIIQGLAKNTFDAINNQRVFGW